jgi:hypothetical protein
MMIHSSITTHHLSKLKDGWDLITARVSLRRYTPRGLLLKEISSTIVKEAGNCIEVVDDYSTLVREGGKRRMAVI